MTLTPLMIERRLTAMGHVADIEKFEDIWLLTVPASGICREFGTLESLTAFVDAVVKDHLRGHCLYCVFRAGAA
jgi:hypothetical protein